MKILVLNSRIYSIEYELIEMPDEETLAQGVLEKIGMETSFLKHSPAGKDEVRIVEPVLDHIRAMELLIKVLTSPEYGVISAKEEIGAVGHRVVHGGEKITKSSLIDDSIKKEIYNHVELAPLHNPYNLKGIDACEKLFPSVPQVAVFDTSFYQNMPEYAYLYALPYHLYKQYGIRKYGFHGISHLYTAEHTAKMMKSPLNKLKIISCHLGAGCSITAIRNGSAVDTTMGFSPLDGIMMSTRSGSVDPEAIIYLMKIGHTINDVLATLNRESGILGVSGISDDMEQVINNMHKKDRRAALAVDMFVYQVQKYIGAYYVVLGGVDAISFTGGIAVNSALVRTLICKPLETIGVKLDKEKNEKCIRKEGPIHSGASAVKVFCVPRDEHLFIARETCAVLKCGDGKKK